MNRPNVTPNIKINQELKFESENHMIFLVQA